MTGSLHRQALEAIDRAIAARGYERMRLLDQAARLHRLAVAAADESVWEDREREAKGQNRQRRH